MFMRLIFFSFLIFLLISCSSFSNNRDTASVEPYYLKPPKSKEQFCNIVTDKEYFRNMLYYSENRLAFYNWGGVFNSGTCWWHSMFTRNATYLSIYKPDLPKPNIRQVKQIILDIVSIKGIVVIPGFKNLQEFSIANGELIQDALNKWQIGDGLIGFGWLRGLQGKTELTPEEMRQTMDAAFLKYKKYNIPIYQKLQMPGLDAHAWLIIGMRKANNGYWLDIIDSNYMEVIKIKYVFGSNKLFKDYHGNFAPYTSRNFIAKKSYDWSINQFCKYNMDSRANSKKKLENQK